MFYTKSIFCTHRPHFKTFVLIGPIPSELASLKNLEILALEENKLEGSIPTWLGGIPSLKELYLGRNAFRGER